MNFEYLLYQYLLKHNKAEIPEFGVFRLTKESAKIDAEKSVIIPPKETVTFEYNPSVESDKVALFIADETQSTLSEAQTELKHEVSKWFQKLRSDNTLNLDNLGQFHLNEENKVVKITDADDDIFGFEKVDLQHLKTLKSKNNLTEDYSFNKNVIWTFVSLIIVGTAALFLFGNQELIFGKSSNIPTKKIVRKAEPQKMTIVPKQDSIKKDSIKPTTNAKIQKTNR